MTGEAPAVIVLTTLDVPYVDTSAGELVWTLDHPQVRPLTAHRVSLPGGDVELRVLGASHQVILRQDAAMLIETVACLPGVEPYLPETADRPTHGRTYTFESRVVDVTVRELRQQVSELHRDDDVFLAAFPAERDAVTALRLDDDPRAVRWHSWHVYPRSKQIVRTTTEVH